MAFCSRVAVEAWRDILGLVLWGSAEEDLAEGLVAEDSIDDEGAPDTRTARRAVWEGEERRSGDMVVGSKVGGGGERSGAVGGWSIESQE